jgi:hypothetical protein
VKKVILGILAVLISFGIGIRVASAGSPLMSNARIDSMSADVREIEDLGLIWLYPNKVLAYKNTADFELGHLNGGGTSEWGGVLVDMGDDFGVLGAYVNRPFYDAKSASYVVQAAPLASYNWLPVGGGDSGLSSNVLDLFWAKSVGGADLGLHFNYGETFNSSENFGLSAGLGFANAGAFSEGNIHVDCLMQNVTAGATKDSGIYTIALGTLWQASLSGNEDIRLFGDFQLLQDKMGAIDENLTLIDLGTSLNHKILDGKGLVSSGLILDYFASKMNTTGEAENSWTLLWNASVEAQTASWLTLRAGVVKAIVARLYHSTGSPTYTDDERFPVWFSTGFGVNWQNWTLNTSVNVSTLENSINHVQPGNGLFFAGDIVSVAEANLQFKF